MAISAYLGTSAKFDKGIRDFAFAYAGQVDADFDAYTAAIKAGTVRLEDEEQAKSLRVVATPQGLDIVSGDSAAAEAPTAAAPAAPDSSGSVSS